MSTSVQSQREAADPTRVRPLRAADMIPIEHEMVDRVLRTLFFAVPPAALLVAGWLAWGGALHWQDLVVLALTYTVTGLGITVGYHRLFTHRSFETTRTVRAQHVQSNFGCAHANTTLRSLLRHGVHGLPKSTTRAGRWGCRRTGFKHYFVCERRSSSPGVNPASVVFQARARR